VSVVTVVFNSAVTISSCIDSVLGQDYDDIEYILVDGNSYDGTTAIIESYGKSIDKFICEDDNGIYDAMNKGIAAASGDIICILNSDDYYPSANVVSNVIAEMHKFPEIDALLTNIAHVSVENELRIDRHYRANWFRPRRLRFGWMPPHPGIFLKRKVYERYGLYKIDYQIAADYEFVVRVFLSGQITYKIFDYLSVIMRSGGVSTRKDSTKIITHEILRSLEENQVYSNWFFVVSRLPLKFVLGFFESRKKILAE
jgi:glycosyltransferase involved in cell wall biosynthesis